MRSKIDLSDLITRKDSEVKQLQLIEMASPSMQDPELLPLAADDANELISIEICAGAGGQALGLEQAGFEHAAVVEIDPWAASTLRLNRPTWHVVGPDRNAPASGAEEVGDVHRFDATPWNKKVHLFAGGVPCPPFSVAGKQLGGDDDRDLFPEALRLINECNPEAIMLENVRGLLSTKFDDYRADIEDKLRTMGYLPDWQLVHAADFGVPQLRPRSILVALRPKAASLFCWPEPNRGSSPTVGEALHDLMIEHGWRDANSWREAADKIGPTLVGGSKKHGGPDLGPTRARAQWAQLGVDGRGVADEAPHKDFNGDPKLTVRMTARIQGFPDDWEFAGKKTASYRQIGNAFPPPVAKAIGTEIAKALRLSASRPDLAEQAFAA